VIGRNDYPQLRSWGVGCFKGDLAKADFCAAMRGCDVVFHVAARAGIWGSRAEVYRNNVVATRQVLRSAIRAGVPKFV
jgi:nucleoside-diphosphate-sugar epimerase